MRDLALWLTALCGAACLSGWTLSDRAHLALAAATIASAWGLVASLLWGSP
jgi:hypothetical protein